MKTAPQTNQIFYVLFDEENNMLNSVDKSHVWTTPFITKAMYFESKAIAERYNKNWNLLFRVVKVSPQYTFVDLISPIQ